jgi:uncharacterized RDD family membrane protein YckC
MSVGHPGLVARRIAAGFVDFSLELGSGFLGSYFGAMVAALAVAMKNENPEMMQSSIWSGFGFGFVFWALAISFLNRALIQGVSRSSIGKKIFKLELISCHQPLTWSTVMKRWVLGILSSIGGLGYSVMFFNRDGRALHDFLTDTDVVPLFEGRNMSVDHDEKETVATQVLSPSFSEQFASRVLVIASTQAERPIAPVIPLPVKVTASANQLMDFSQHSEESKREKTLADILVLRPSTDSALKKETIATAVDDEKKIA